MWLCKKHGIEVSGCSRQPTGLFDVSICDGCQKSKNGNPQATYWQLRLGIEPGMSREQALALFLEWRATKRTCQRCGLKKLVDFCPVRVMCGQANEYERSMDYASVRGDVDGRGIMQVAKDRTERTEIFASRKRDALRSVEQNEASLS